MSAYPSGIDWRDLYEAYRLIRDLRAKALALDLNPKAITIALWMAVEMDRILALRRISMKEYESLMDYGRKEAQTVARRFEY